MICIPTDERSKFTDVYKDMILNVCASADTDEGYRKVGAAGRILQLC